MDEKTERFYDLIWPHRSVVLRAAQILAGSVHEGEDLMQETFIKGFRSIGQFKVGTDAKKWLMTILRHTWIDRLRTKGSTKAVSLDQLAVEPTAEAASDNADGASWQNPQEILERFADRDIIQALQCLSEEDRWTVLLVDVEGLDHREASVVLDVPIGTIKSRTHRSRSRLRDVLLPVAKERRYIHE